jgi:formylmethanofuran dehydrogenase subunit A
MWLDVQTSEPAKITEEMKRRFREYWTVEYENYPVTEHYLEVSHPITVKAGV